MRDECIKFKGRFFVKWNWSEASVCMKKRRGFYCPFCEQCKCNIAYVELQPTANSIFAMKEDMITVAV